VAFEILPKDTPVKITAIAEELGLRPDILLAAVRDKRVVMMFLKNCWFRKVKEFDSGLGFKYFEISDAKVEFLKTIYVILDKSTIDIIINNGNFSFNNYSIDTENGCKAQYFFIDEHDDEIEKIVSINDIYMAACDASSLRDEIKKKPELLQSEINSRREKPLLKVIGALLTLHYYGERYRKGKENDNISAYITAIHQGLANKNIRSDGMSESTLKPIIKGALEAIKENQEK